MKISRNDDLEVIRVLPNGSDTNEIYIRICIESDFKLCQITVTINEARQIADEILKICNESEK